ncbi:MAG TPA: ABC transporter permease subunit [Dehalococcoidales bacterium]
MSAFFTVTKKELQDHFNSWRFLVMLFIIVTGIIYVYFAIGNIKTSATGAESYVFLSLFTTQAFNISTSLIPSSFLTLMSTVLPIAGIVLGLDAINGEKNNGTLSRLVSQPIYRDNIINAKFLAGIITIGVTLISTVLLVSALGLWKLGVPPSSEEIIRTFFFLVFGIVYGGFWLGLAILFSTLFKQVALSAILSIAVWIFFAFFFPLIYQSMASNAQTIQDAERAINITRISPLYLFSESMAVVLFPQIRSASQMLQVITTDAGNFLLATPLSVWQSFIAVWWEVLITVVLTIVCFAGSYLKFMFEEIRSL